VTTPFRCATIFIALKSNHWLNLIFRRGKEAPHNFYAGPFNFNLNATDGNDVCRYDVTCEDFVLRITFVGVDCSVPCGRRSNLDFVQYVWRNREMAAFQRYAMTFLPNSPYTHGRLLCLRYYRVASSGWTFNSGCGTFAANFRVKYRPTQAALVLMMLASVISADSSPLSCGTWL
jgi:hypothetical protein